MNRSVTSTLAHLSGRQLVALAVAIASTITIVTGIGACLIAPDCDIEVRGTSASPAGDIVVTAFERACGATTRFNTRVSVHSGTVAADEGEVTFSTCGQYAVTYTWLDARTVDVVFDCFDSRGCDTRIGAAVAQPSAANGLSLRYRYGPRLEAAMRDTPRP